MISTPKLQIQQTTIKETDRPDLFRVELILADGPDEETAQNAVAVRVHCETAANHPNLPQIQAAALQLVRNALVAEIQRLEQARGRGAD